MKNLLRIFIGIVKRLVRFIIDVNSQGIKSWKYNVIFWKNYLEYHIMNDIAIFY